MKTYTPAFLLIFLLWGCAGTNQDFIFDNIEAGDWVQINDSTKICFAKKDGRKMQLINLEITDKNKNKILSLIAEKGSVSEKNGYAILNLENVSVAKANKPPTDYKRYRFKIKMTP